MRVSRNRKGNLAVDSVKKNSSENEKQSKAGVARTAHRKFTEDWKVIGEVVRDG